MEIVNAYELVGSYRRAAELCGTTHKTVKRIIERRDVGEARRRVAMTNTSGVQALIAERVRSSDGRISAKRLLPMVQAAGYNGSARTLRRAVADAKATWKRQRRTYRPWVPTPGEHLAIDWAAEYGWQIFCAVVAWSRYRFVRFAADQRRETTLALLAECFAELDGVPAVVLSDRMACLKAGVVANVVVPHPEYVRFATFYKFKPDFCEAADPESKGMVENLAGYVQRDLVVPAELERPWSDLVEANAAARVWCAEVNGRLHSETAAVPFERLQTERGVLRPLPLLRPPLRQGEMRKVDRLGMVRFGSGRYAVPEHLVGEDVEVAAHENVVVIRHAGNGIVRHAVVGPGEVALGSLASASRQPARAVRPRTAAEVAFIGLGPAAESFLRSAAAAGTLRLEHELTDIVELEAAWGRAAVIHALERATRFRRFRAADVRAILMAGSGVPTPIRPGLQLQLDLPEVTTRPLSAYAMATLQ
jgi:hypothetical protein